MAGPQHPYPAGFQMSQQTAMRNQFGNSPQAGLIPSPQQTGMVGQTPYGVALQQANQSGLTPPQQNAQLQMQQQQLQQQEIQQQANQSNILPQVNQPQQQLASQSKEFNTASLCKLGQETVQDIMARTMEIFTTLKALYPPNGTTQAATASNERKVKLNENIRAIRMLFKRLRVIYGKCNENCQGMEYTHIESLIPLKEEWDMKSDEKKSSELYRAACEENKEVMEQVILKNRHLKETIDHLRRIIWEINTMLTMRRS